MIQVDLATYLYRLGKAKRKKSQGKRRDVKECEGSEGVKKANEAIAKMREGILKVNKDNMKVWDGSAMGARYSAKEREETRRNAMGYEGEADRKPSTS